MSESECVCMICVLDHAYMGVCVCIFFILFCLLSYFLRIDFALLLSTLLTNTGLPSL